MIGGRKKVYIHMPVESSMTDAFSFTHFGRLKKKIIRQLNKPNETIYPTGERK